jgi:hypothetical protein
MLEVITNFVWVYLFSGELKEPGDHLWSCTTITWAFRSTRTWRRALAACDL